MCSVLARPLSILDHAHGVVPVLGLAKVVFAHLHHRIRGENVAALTLRLSMKAFLRAMSSARHWPLALGEELAELRGGSPQRARRKYSIMPLRLGDPDARMIFSVLARLLHGRALFLPCPAPFISPAPFPP